MAKEKPKKTDMTIEVTLTEEMLGMSSANPEIYSEFIASRAPKETDTSDELDAIPDVAEEIEKTTTIFPKDEQGRPFIWDYQVKGMFKDAGGMLRRVEGTASKNLKAFKKIIDGLIFVFPRKIPLVLPAGTDITMVERPLRAQTAQGERVALARSEAVPAGTKFTFQVQCLDPTHLRHVEEWMDYTKLRGFGQWRNSGKGRATWREVTSE